ncbi:MAG: hypothetical protein VCC99_17040 [Alphaproteobacteria bacterium]
MTSKLGPVVEVTAILVMVFLGLWFISPMMPFGWLAAVGLFSVWAVLMLELWASRKTRDEDQSMTLEGDNASDSESDVANRLRDLPNNDGS